MKRLLYLKKLFVLVISYPLILASAHAQTSASSCAWPMYAGVQVPESQDYPTSVNFEFSKQRDSSDLIKIKETTRVSLNKLVKDYPSLVESSDAWTEMQSRLDCNNRASNYSHRLSVQGKYLIASFSANVEKYWCASAHVPCPVFPADPFRMCLQETNGKLWGATVFSESKIELQKDEQGAFNAVVIETKTSSNTSNEQNFIRDLLGASMLGPIGVNAIQEMESTALNTIKDSMRDGFDHQRFQLADGKALPEFPGYKPKIISLKFSMHNSIEGLVVIAHIEREATDFRESTGCSLAKKLGARRGGRGIVRGGDRAPIVGGGAPAPGGFPPQSGNGAPPVGAWPGRIINSR